MSDCPKCRSGFLCADHGGRDVSDDEMWVTGRDAFLMESLAGLFHSAAENRHAVTAVCREKRGANFDVQVHVDGQPTGHIAHVTVTLDRLEEHERS